jgi:hypothetical protein
MWLLTEGLIPLFGAGIVYLIWGWFRKLAAPGNSYVWRAAIDSMGWLYGAIIIAIQSANRFFGAGPDHRAMAIGCVACAIFCGMQLLAGMCERGANPAWQPQATFKIPAIIFVAVTLWFGYSAQIATKSESISIDKETKNERGH